MFKIRIFLKFGIFLKLFYSTGKAGNFSWYYILYKSSSLIRDWSGAEFSVFIDIDIDLGFTDDNSSADDDKTGFMDISGIKYPVPWYLSSVGEMVLLWFGWTAPPPGLIWRGGKAPPIGGVALVTAGDLEQLHDLGVCVPLLNLSELTSFILR